MIPSLKSRLQDYRWGIWEAILALQTHTAFIPDFQEIPDGDKLSALHHDIQERFMKFHHRLLGLISSMED